MARWQVFRVQAGALRGMWVSLLPGVMACYWLSWRAAFDFATTMAWKQRQAEAQIRALWSDL